MRRPSGRVGGECARQGRDATEQSGNPGIAARSEPVGYGSRGSVRSAPAACFLPGDGETPVAMLMNWRQGDDVIIPSALSHAQARMTFPAGWKTVKPYLRVVAQPRD